MLRNSITMDVIIEHRIKSVVVILERLGLNFIMMPVNMSLNKKESMVSLIVKTNVQKLRLSKWYALAMLVA